MTTSTPCAAQYPEAETTRALPIGTTLALVAMTFLMNPGAILLRTPYAR